MPYIADMKKANDLQQAKKLVGNGQCVALVHAVAVTPPTSLWSQGDSVINNKDIVPGTVIATFDANGRYGNHTDGTSHAAIYLGQTKDGILVLDQWKGSTHKLDHAPQPRLIRFVHSRPAQKVDQGDQYYVVK